MTDSPKHVFLVDGSGFIFRAFHAVPPMTRGDGTPVNAVFGFTNMLNKLLSDTDADHIAVVFDAARKTFRSDIYPEYKAQRPPTPEELIPQFPLIREATRAFSVACVEQEGFEADDLIATYARQAVALGARVTIVSSDKDLMQLIGDGVDMFDPMKNKPIGADEVMVKFGVGPDKVIDVQALCGDSTDNVPGVPGIGPKTAALLIQDYGSLEALLERAGEIKQPKRRETLIAHADMARLSKRLVTLETHVPVVEPLESFLVQTPDRQKLINFLRECNFKSILARIEGAGGGTARSTPSQGNLFHVIASQAAPAEAVAAPPVSYELVTSLEALDRWIAAAHQAGRVSVDTETTGLNPLRCELVGISLSIEPGQACYIPLKHSPGEAQGSLDLANSAGPSSQAAPTLIPRDEALARLKDLLEHPGVLKVGHNVKFDLQMLWAGGIAMAPIDDTMLLSYVLEGGAHGHGMDELARLHLGHNTISFAEVCGTGKAQITFDRVPLDKALDYAAEDADITGRLWHLFRPRLLAEHMVTVYETLERPLIPVLTEMERHGIKVDATELRAMSEEFGRRMAVLEEEIHRLAGETFNVGSPKQLGEILFGKMSLAGGKKSAKTGAYQTGADVLENLAGQGHDLPRKVLDWRQIQKLKSTYADALVEQIHPQTRRLHTSFSMAVTTTGRLSSSDPNLQNIPIRSEEGRRIRRAFVAEPGHVLLSADYSQIELRLVAHVAEVQGLRDAFHLGADIHAATASQVFSIPLEGMDPMIRRSAKAINFGIIYGMSPFGLAQQLGIPQGEAKRYIEAYFDRYPEIRTYMETTRTEAREHGYVVTPYGRKVFTPGILEKNPQMRAFAERAAINGPIQGGAADIIKRAMIRLPPALREAGLSARMLLQVHDELVFEVAEAEAEATRDLVKRVMEEAAVLSVPLVVDVGIGASWAEAH